MVERWLRQDVPVIVDWMSVSGDAAMSSIPRGHYSVVCGLAKEHIILEDPSIGRRRILSRRTFTSLWYDFKYLFPRRGDDLIVRRMIVVAPRMVFEIRGNIP